MMTYKTAEQFNLSNMSAVELERLAKRAKQLAEDLRKEQPSYALALEHGVRDKSYKTVRYGWIASYEGEAVITMTDGRRWKAIGHGPTGTAEWVGREGYIEFIPLDE